MFELITIAMLVAACAAIEIELMEKKPWVADLVLRLGPVGSIGFSLGLSLLLTHLFGVVGYVPFVAGMVSTFVVQPYYAAKRSGHWDKMQGSYRSQKMAYQAKRDLYIRRVNQIVTLVRVIWAVVMVPFKIVFAIFDGAAYVNTKAGPAKAKASAAKTRVTNYAKQVRY